MNVQVKMVQWFDQHWYKLELVNGKLETRWIPSVTTKLGIVDKPFLPKWRGDIGNREADMRLFEAQEKGTRIHNAWHVFCTGGTIIYNPWQRPNYTDPEIADLTLEADGNIAVIRYQDEMLALTKLQKVVDLVKPKMIFSEKIVYSLMNNDAGTADNAWEIPKGEYPINGKNPLYISGGRYLIDLKTGGVVDDNAFCQTAAYVKCDEEIGAPPYAGTIIFHTSANTRKGIEGFAALLRSRAEMEEDYKTYRITAELWERKNENAAPRVFEFPSLLSMKQKENTNGSSATDPRLVH
jgi:hypothetical protein